MVESEQWMSIYQDEGVVQQKKEKGDWVQPFLQRTFFNTCSIHEASKNELNKYCITCELPACRHCISCGTHGQHKVLQIYRYVYKDVVSISDMEKHIDCSKIQTYKCNKQLVISLNPLPHSGSETDVSAACEVCHRKLLDPNSNLYCSIACKVEALSRKANESEPPFLSVQSPPPDEESTQAMIGKRKRKRKGVPHRSPLT